MKSVYDPGLVWPEARRQHAEQVQRVHRARTVRWWRLRRCGACCRRWPCPEYAWAQAELEARWWTGLREGRGSWRAWRPAGSRL